MPRSDEDNQQIRAARRQEILAAAVGVFAVKGIARTKVADIAAAAGLSHGLLYHYFRSKEEVFETMVDEMLLAADADLAPSTERAVVRLRAAIGRRLTTLRRADATRIVMQAVLQGEVSPALHRRLSAHLLHIRSRLCELIARAQAEGDVDDATDPDELARALIFLFRGLSLDVADDPLPLPEPETILRLLGAKSAPKPAAGRIARAPKPRRTGT